MRFNVLHKPFDNPKIRQAVLYALDQKPFLEANVGNPNYYKRCKSLFPCGSPLESTKGWDDKLSGNVAKAKALLKEAGYDGTPVVLLHQTDIAGPQQPRHRRQGRSSRRPASRSTCRRWTGRRWSSRRAKKDAPAKGGWSAFFTSWGAPDVMNPVSAAFLNASCDKATFGWPCDAELEKLRDAYAKETDPAKQKQIAEQVQLRVLDYPTTCRSASSPRRRRSAPTSTACCRRRRWRCGTSRRSERPSSTPSACGAPPPMTGGGHHSLRLAAGEVRQADEGQSSRTLTPSRPFLEAG